MCVRILALFRHNPLHTRLRKAHTYIYNMDKAYYRQKDDEHFLFTFQYNDTDLKVHRQFNFCRQVTETVGTFLGRVNTNVEKVLAKKAKKKKKKAVENEIIEPQQISSNILLNNSAVNADTPCKEVFKSQNSVLLKILEKDYFVVINSPWIDSASLPSAILARFPVYPSKFESVNIDRKLSEFIWFKSIDKKEWTKVGAGFIYIPTNEDVGAYLKLHCIPKNEHSEGPIIEVITDVTVQADPGYCPFETRHKFTQQKTQGKEFRVVSYNILADLYCDSDFTRTELYPYCPAYALHIDYRKLLIVKELLGYNADIICLQEVDKKVFVNDLEPVFSNLDYESNFSIKGGTVAEGLACFYNAKRFKLLDSTRVVLAEHINTDPIYKDIWDKIKENEKLVERILQRTTTVQTTTLQSKEHDEILLVGNTHLYFHPDSDHIRLLQCGLALKHIEAVYNKIKEGHTSDKMRVSIILCGDFNSVPECGIYRLMTTGEVPQDCIDFRSNQEEAINTVNLSQPFKFDSACGTPKYTNYTAGFADCLDYIYYDKSNLSVSEVVPLPSLEELALHTALPSIVFPSDHISLVSSLKWN